ncbi:sugar phosphate isomerase/epimerase family protein [Alkalicoccobacillus porphyridii]|uniref:Sugar phosphate isomerase/epimerase n=1 Tax=Alkalicoccobacillus porphyridii TaxID=2597270 RepID=A0A554A0R2_9BACI|nr:sugar phosphate isomerase/epimerase family protein [Alkalicoccobacillus porphyridii]TSB47263.1 sugar phosphate isomerase/epimerase [Alkalicoccobacillus porphyridii]
MSGQAELSRLSLNQITTENWSLSEAIDGCERNEVPWISIWRHKLAEYGMKETVTHLKNSGIKVSSLCRGGMFPASTQEERNIRIEDNKRAIEEAAELNTDTLVLVCGPSPDKDITQARKWVQEGIEAIIPYAEQHGIKLGIEPLHPMYAADRSVINTLGQANSLVKYYQSEQVGVVIDAFHVWWDPQLAQDIETARGSILGFHVSDWKVPIYDMFKGRSMMGDGVIDLHGMRKQVEAAGYAGPIEVEIMNQELWDRPGDEVLQLMKERYLEHV